MTDTLTVLHAHRRRLAKAIAADGTVRGYDLARTIDAAEVPVRDLDHLSARLHQLAARSDCAVVRGALIDPANATGIRRLLHSDPQTGEVPTFREQPRRWLALDMDGGPLPGETDPRDLAACATAVVPLLPVAFHGAACIVQATASHGIKPGARLRLWYWLDRPLSGDEAKRWLRATPADPSIFGAVQLIYTAAPVFEGRADHLPERLVMAPGRPVVDAPSAAALAPPPRPVEPPRPLPDGLASRYGFGALRHAYTNIASAGEGARHPTAKAEAWTLARLVRRGIVTEADMAEVIRRGLTSAGKPVEEADAISAWALAHRADDGGARHV